MVNSVFPSAVPIFAPTKGEWWFSSSSSSLAFGVNSIFDFSLSSVVGFPGGTQLSSVQLLSCVWLFATPWTAAHQASLSITRSQSLLKVMSIKSVLPPNHLILCHPLLLLPSFSKHQGLFQWFSSSHQLAIVLELQLQHQSFQWIFRTDFL